MNIEDAVIEVVEAADAEYVQPWSTDHDAAAWLMHPDNAIDEHERSQWALNGLAAYAQNLYESSVDFECLRKAYETWRNGGHVNADWVRGVMASAFAMYDPHGSAFNVWEMVDNPERYGTPQALFEAMMRLQDGVEPTELW